MSDARDSINQAFGIWAVIAGAIMAGAITALFALVPVWGWIALLSFAVLSGVALLSFTDPASRAFLAGTLRNSTYTQIYTTLTKRIVQRIWGALCDEPGEPRAMLRERIGAPTLFRHALTWRLYDKALLIAVAYPLLLPVGQWVVTGDVARIGSLEFLAAAPFWWDRAVVAGALFLVFVGAQGFKMLTASSTALLQQSASIWRLISFATAASIAVAFVDENFAVLAVLTLGAAMALMTSILVGAIAAIGILTGAFGAALVADIGLALSVGVAGLAAVLCIGTVIGVVATGKSAIARWVMALATGIVVLFGVAAADLSEVTGTIRAAFLFLAVLPLLNALFDTLSYAVTLTLMRRGLRSSVPWLWGLLDLAIACVLFLALGCTLIVVIHGLNLLAGVPLIDLPALLAGVRTEPSAYLWLYLMLFSTILPTALHAGLSLLGVQGLWPRAARRPVAVWVAGATGSPLAAVRASLALGMIWTLPLIGLGAVIWLLWAISGDAVTWLLGHYFDLLLRLAAIPVGAI